ncbi:BTB/POZ protein [Jimgerdemannia flammicorona]|uniref:BTB/POZ protein n=1 Tax=Jimgerdemannia flammicorona TaxID=994334 RepID=A0A433A0K8_9FUNG|nr:BTB/POZ protein [Jimgerdemannia flammicorona]
MSNSNRIRLNVGGQRFETNRKTLCQFPHTLLGALFSEGSREIPQKDDNGDYFFDRNGDAFSVIIDFYRNGGKIFLPYMWHRFSPDVLAAELAYFRIPHKTDLLPKTPKPDERPLFAIAQDFPESKKYFSEIVKPCKTRAREMLDTYGNFIVKVTMIGLEAILSNIYQSTANVRPYYMHFVFTRTPEAPLSAITITTSPMNPGNVSILPKIPKADYASLDWRPLRSFLCLETDSEWLPEQERRQLVLNREEFNRALSSAVHGGKVLKDISAAEEAHHVTFDTITLFRLHLNVQPLVLTPSQ